MSGMHPRAFRINFQPGCSRREKGNLRFSHACTRPLPNCTESRAGYKTLFCNLLPERDRRGQVAPASPLGLGLPKSLRLLRRRPAIATIARLKNIFQRLNKMVREQEAHLVASGAKVFFCRIFL